MQETPTTSLTWTQLALSILATLLTGGGIFKLIDTWRYRKKPAADIDVVEATATEIKVRSHSTAGDSLARMMDRLDVAQTTIDRLRGERDDWQLEAFDARVELRESQNENAQLMVQAKIDNHQIRKQMAFIEARGLKEIYIALDKPREVNLEDMADEPEM